MNKTTTIILFFLIIPFGVGIASAESGIISIGDNTNVNFTYGYGGAGTGAHPQQWTDFLFDVADYNTIWQITAYANPTSAWIFGSAARSTTFTITSGGTGSGTVYYNRAAESIVWDFSANTIITNKHIVLAYNNNIFNDITGFVTRYDSGGNVGVSNPVCFYYSDTQCESGFGGYSIQIKSFVSTQTSFMYTVSYTQVAFGTNYNLSVYKNNIAIWIRIKNSTNIVFNETHYTLNNFSFSHLQDTGIILNGTLAGGQTREVAINLTGSPYDVPPVIPPVVDPTTGVGMRFDATTYIQGSTAGLSWLRTIPTPISLEDHIEVKNPQGQVIYAITNPGDSGATKIKLNDVGIYEAKFIRCSFFCILSDTLSTATTTVPAPGASYIILNSTMSAFSISNFTYYNGNSIGSNKLVVGEYWEPATNRYENIYNSYPIYQQEVTVPFICDRITKYKFYVEGTTQEYFSDCVLNNSHPQYNISISNLTLSSYNVAFGDWIEVSYEIDSVNFTGNKTYLSVIDSGNQELFNITLPQQREYNVQWRVSDRSDLNAYMRFKPGTNTIRMISSTGTTLDSHNVSVSSVDAEGYGLEVKESYCTNESKTFKYYSPGTVNLTISKDGTVKKSYTLNTSITGKIISFSLPEGTYDFSMTVDAIQKRSAQTTISTCEATVTTTTRPGEGWGETTDANSKSHTVSILDNWVGTLGMGINNTTRLWFAVIVIIFAVIIGAIIAKDTTVAVACGFLPFAFFASISLDPAAQAAGIEYIPKWAIAMFIIILALAVKILR